MSQTLERTSRVCLLVEGNENRHLLADWLSGEYDVLDDDAPFETPYDLCIVDQAAFRRNVDALAARKDAEAPAFLPHLLVVTGRRGARGVEDFVDQPLDEVIEAPIRKAELSGRIRNLLQTRELSVELHRRNERLEELNRINAAMREINRVLVRTSSREEIEAAVTDRLVTVDSYRYCWIGELDPTGRSVVPRAWAGESDDPPGTAELEAASAVEDTAWDAIQSREVAVVQDFGIDPGSEWHVDRGYAAAISIPITFRNTVYGAFTVYADHVDAFDRDERNVLREFGETIGLAINATDRKRALLTDRVVELDLQIHGVDEFLDRASLELSCTLSLEGIVSDADGRFFQYITATDASADEVVPIAEAADTVENVKPIRDDDDECHLEVTFTGTSIVTALGEHGATVRGMSVDQGVGHVTVQLPHDADVRGILDAFRVDYPDTELVAKREVEHTIETRQKLQRTITDELTDRQQTALRTAYYAGFFNRPRDSTGEEVADTLGITSATFHQHLRTAERKLFDSLFEGNS